MDDTEPAEKPVAFHGKLNLIGAQFLNSLTESDVAALRQIIDHVKADPALQKG
ncbi:MAG: hypothetical protein KG075_09490 [Alphaproteobacteria bacterium]|nr:hypothetical protein [Alphaproteobacteria bacterium]